MFYKKEYHIYINFSIFLISIQTIRKLNISIKYYTDIYYIKRII